MGRYEKILNMLMDFDQSIRFSAISNTNGDILWHSKRTEAKIKVPLAETKRTLKREAADWIDRSKLEDRNNLGRAMYHITSFEKIKTYPLYLLMHFICCLSV